jgi:hypothetical protein
MPKNGISVRLGALWGYTMGRHKRKCIFGRMGYVRRL